MSRLIDADRLLEERRMHTYYHLPNGDTAVPIVDIQHAPTVEPKPHWIPCSERLPEDGIYIVYAPYYTGGSSSAKEYHNGIMFSKIKNGKWSIEHGYYKRPNCVWAWMPLPEPYQEGEQND